MRASQFKIVIVGGGPVGLLAAHAIDRAGLDFVVLEQRESIVIDEGASLVLGPNSLRVMHQLGLLHDLLKIGMNFRHQKVFTLSGKKWKDTFATLELFKKCHGSAPMVFSRAELIQALYDGLTEAAKEKVIVSKKVAGIKSCDTGVEIDCTDGTKHLGSIVLGADGVHSRTRQMMRESALTARPNAPWDMIDPFEAKYRAVWCSFSRPSEPGQAFETQHKDRGLVYFTSRDRGYILMFERLANSSARNTSYEGSDVMAAAENFADFPVTEKMRVKDLLDKNIKAGMVDLEEGVVKHWYWNRSVLAGDACHKLTPNSGLGFNNGVQDIVTLCNGIRRAVIQARDGDPDLATLTAVFRQYESERLKTIRRHTFVSTHLVRINSWKTPLHYFVARYIMASKRIEYFTLKYVVSRFIRQGLVFDYISVKEPFVASVPWTHPTEN